MAQKLKQSIKNGLQAAGLYQPAQAIWVKRPDLRMKSWNFGYRLGGAKDHLPIPPAKLIHKVINTDEIAWFLASGRISFDGISYALSKNKYKKEDFKAVLDFGCGCGRVIRCWRDVHGPHLHGTDYNPDLIQWSRRHLDKLGDFHINLMSPPMDFKDNTFDFVYALSVFTHMPEELQTEWMDELHRIIAPDGLLLITLHGRSRIHQLSPTEQEEFLSGKMVVIYPESAGENICGAFHPEKSVRTELAKRFTVVDFIESGARDSNQDIYLLKKPSASI